MTCWLPETDHRQGPKTNVHQCYNISASFMSRENKCLCLRYRQLSVAAHTEKFLSEYTRLRELTSAARGSQDAESRNLVFTF